MLQHVYSQGDNNASLSLFLFLFLSFSFSLFFFLSLSFSLVLSLSLESSGRTFTALDVAERLSAKYDAEDARPDQNGKDKEREKEKEEMDVMPGLDDDYMGAGRRELENEGALFNKAGGSKGAQDVVMPDGTLRRIAKGRSGGEDKVYEGPQPLSKQEEMDGYIHMVDEAKP
jgi:hypothetical protein